MKKLNIHYFQHVPFEGLGCIEGWATNSGHSLTSTKFYEDLQLPKIDAIDWLIILGGPMSINDEAEHQWLKDEKAFIRQAINAGKTVLGICLGSQLIASVLGSSIFPNPQKEIGWLPIQPVATAPNILFNTESELTVFHWHGETFELPEGAQRLAGSEGCANQAFLYNDVVLGLQFHLEVTHDSLKQMLIHGKEELVDGKYIQTEASIIARSSLVDENNQRMHSILHDLETL